MARAPTVRNRTDPLAEAIGQLRRFHWSSATFDELEADHKITLSPTQRRAIASILLVYAERELRHKLDEHQRDEAAKRAIRLKVRLLIGAIEKQRKSRAAGGSAAGLIALLRTSSLYVPDDLRLAADERVDKSVCAFERCLSALSQNLAPQLAPTKNHDYLFEHLATVFASSGGNVGNTEDGPFVRFVSFILDAAPTALKCYVKPRLSRNIQEWLSRTRPSARGADDLVEAEPSRWDDALSPMARRYAEEAAPADRRVRPGRRRSPKRSRKSS